MQFDLKKAKFDVGIGSVNFADSVLFRSLEIPYIKINEEDYESYTMHAKMGVPILTSMYPSSSIWSRFSYLNLPDFGSLNYRFPFFMMYQWDKYARWSHKGEMRSIIGEKRAHLIDDWDQDHAMFIGHGARAGVYQSIMMKPPNVRYVYPLAIAQTEVEIPSYLASKDALIVFNAESERMDDLMYDKEQQESLKIQINDALKENLGVIVLCPPSLAEMLKTRFADDLKKLLFIHETTFAYQVKLVNKSNPNQHLVWVASCTQQNIINGIGIHKGIMIGYARNAQSTA